MKRSFLKIVCAALLAPLYMGCEKPKTYSDIPVIQFVSLTQQRNVAGLDSTSIITISFTDGDGDIGYASASGNPKDFIVSSFHKQSGVWVEDTTLETSSSSSGFSGTLPYLTPSGSNKALTGVISMTQYFVGLVVRNDTIHYEVYILDRALHQSNIITTSDIVISTH